MFKLYDSETSTALGRISDERFIFLQDHLEEESGKDQDYDFNAATIDALEQDGVDAELVALLRRTLGDREGVELRRERADEPAALLSSTRPARSPNRPRAGE